MEKCNVFSSFIYLFIYFLHARLSSLRVSGHGGCHKRLRASINLRDFDFDCNARAADVQAVAATLWCFHNSAGSVCRFPGCPLAEAAFG